MFRDSGATVLCWAMGITQHRNAVATIKEIANVALAAGQHRQARRRPLPGARSLQRAGRPDDGHLGAPAAALPRRICRRSSASTRRGRTASTRSTRSGRSATGTAKVFFAMGGNFVAAAPDTHVTEAAMRRAALTVQVSTKLNRSHVVPGEEALILPTLGRSEQDHTGGVVQRVTVEDSHVGGARLPRSARAGQPAAALRGRHRLLAGRGRARGPARPAVGRRSGPTTPRSGAGSRNVVPGCAAYDEKVDQPGGFVLPHPPRDSRTFPTEPGKAVFTVSPIDVLHVPEGRLLMQTLRSHDQFNTTIYGLDDRYRGVSGGRRVVFVHPDDITALGLADGPGRRPGERVDRRLGAARAGVPGGALRPAARAAPRRTTRRPTRWSRWTPPRSAATARPRSRSSCGWSHSPGAAAARAARHSRPGDPPTRSPTWSPSSSADRAPSRPGPTDSHHPAPTRRSCAGRLHDVRPHPRDRGGAAARRP